MTYPKLKLALGICAAILLLGGATTVVLAGEGADGNLPPGEIFKKAQEKYASLTSYSDAGQTVATLNGTTITHKFTIKLARPNLYRIEWEQSSDSAAYKSTSAKGTVWSAGAGDFLDMGFGGVKKQSNQEIALSSATGISGSAAATIPGTFFKMKWGNQLIGSVSGQKQQADEKVGDVDCYVFTSDGKIGQTHTIWIGKGDFLIHQVRNVTSAEALKAALDKAAQDHPEIAAQMKASGFQSQGVTSIETHTNIVVNPKLSPTDFAH